MFVDGALPGDQVLATITQEKKRLLFAEVSEVLEAGPHRVASTCEHFREGCGGCDWQFASTVGATELRRQIVAESLRRLGKIDSVEVRTAAEVDGSLETSNYRTTVRAAVVDGLAGFRKSKSNDIVTVHSCETAHPLAEEILTQGRFPGASEITIKVGSRTGERLVISDAPQSDAKDAVVPDGVRLITREQLKAGETAWIHEEVAGHRFRISAGSFFQCRPDGAESLLDLAGQAIEGSSGPLLDAYGGVGLFGAVLGQDRKVTLVESNPSSIQDAKVNLNATADVVQSRFERWKPSTFGAVVADPARRGLAKEGVAQIDATNAPVVALISCDPASLARDARLLVDVGFTLDWVRTVDLFGQTSHVEAVSRFTR